MTFFIFNFYKTKSRVYIYIIFYLWVNLYNIIIPENYTNFITTIMRINFFMYKYINISYIFIYFINL